MDAPSIRLAVYLTCFIWASAEVALGLAGSRRSNASADRGSLRLIVIAIVGAVALGRAAAHLGSLRLPGSSVGQGLVGICVMWVGMALRLWAILTLGRFFSPQVRVREDHQVIRSGPYARIRHPAYAGSLLAFAGLGVALGNWVGLIGMPLVVFLAFRYRMAREEEVLATTLGQPYREYMSQTKRLIPGVY